MLLELYKITLEQITLPKVGPDFHKLGICSQPPLSVHMWEQCCGEHPATMLVQWVLVPSGAWH